MSNLPLAIVAPCFNEGEVAVRFVRELEQVLATLPVTSRIVMVDDASSDGTLASLRALEPSTERVGIETIALRYNMGHQEAIYQGLLRAQEIGAERIVVMDSDGEDDPMAIPAMWSMGDRSIVLVNRGKRSEDLRFKLGYIFYKWMFRMVTRKRISFGNFSMIDRQMLEVVIDRGFVHYAAFLSRQRAATGHVTFNRRARLDGRSKMSFRSLSIHAFRSLIEYSEDVLALFLKAFFLLAVLALGSIAFILVIKLFTEEAIPGWASILSVSLINSTLLCLGFFSIGLLLANSLHRRDRAGRALYRVVGHGS